MQGCEQQVPDKEEETQHFHLGSGGGQMLSLHLHCRDNITESPQSGLGFVSEMFAK